MLGGPLQGQRSTPTSNTGGCAAAAESTSEQPREGFPQQQRKRGRRQVVIMPITGHRTPAYPASASEERCPFQTNSIYNQSGFGKVLWDG